MRGWDGKVVSILGARHFYWNRFASSAPVTPMNFGNGSAVLQLLFTCRRTRKDDSVSGGRLWNKLSLVNSFVPRRKERWLKKQ